jgi:hypothetical protein
MSHSNAAIDKPVQLQNDNGVTAGCIVPDLERLLEPLETNFRLSGS